MIGVLWYGLAQAFQLYRTSLYEPGAFLSEGTRFGNILMYVAPFFPAICIGFMIGDGLISCIPAGREALHPTEKSSLKSTQAVMAKMVLVVATITLPLAFLGAQNFFSLTPDTIAYRPMFSFRTAHYTWSDVNSITTGCYLKKSVDFSFLARLRDGTQIDFLIESRPTFRAAYPEIASALRGHSYLFSHDGMTPRCLNATPQSWMPYLMRSPSAAN